MTRTLLLALCAATVLLSPRTGLAAPTLSSSLAVQVTKPQPLTGAILGFFDHKGSLIGICEASGTTSAISDGSETHWLSLGGESHWTCLLDGAVDGDGLAVFASEEHAEAWFILADGGSLILSTWEGDKAGTIENASGGLAWFDLDGTQPEFLDLDSSTPWAFDLDGTQPEFLPKDTTWLELAAAELLAL